MSCRPESLLRIGSDAGSYSSTATDDRMIPPSAQRTMAERAGATTTEAPGSHAIYVSQTATVANLITQAAGSLRPASSMA